VGSTQRVMAMAVYRTRQQAIPKDDRGPLEVSDGALGHYQNKNPQLDRVLAVVREFCAIGMESKVAEDGRQALEHTRGVWMKGYSDCPGGPGRIIWDLRGKHDGHRRDGNPGPGGALSTH
jgi:hypothetical protein